MDINLPGMDGFEASIEIRKVYPDIKIIAQTAYATTEDRQKSYASGCIDFLSKPIKKEVLLEKIKEHLQ
jgi:CheY-like chemotaxis protein